MSAESPPRFPPPPSRSRAARLRERLLSWFETERRDLPWRRTRDPYAIWISEAMLQQTRVETVIAYWHAFLERFPTIEALAEAAEEDVLAAWSGLGYYRRARSLQAAARAIVELHGGRFPEGRDDALALPGVGRYTAGAVLSIAFDAPVPLVDGNVERVFSRLFGLDAAVGSGELARECWTLAEGLVPRDGGAGDWNQALMELGATVCTPRAPRCLLCPVCGSCRARRSGSPEALPRPRVKVAPIDVALDVACLEREGRLLLERRPAGGRMAGMWELPTVERPNADGELSGLYPPDWTDSVPIVADEALFELRHGITNHRIRATARRASAKVELEGEPWGWFDPGAARRLALTGMAKKALRVLEG